MDCQNLSILTPSFTERLNALCFWATSIFKDLLSLKHFLYFSFSKNQCLGYKSKRAMLTISNAYFYSMMDTIMIQ